MEVEMSFWRRTWVLILAIILLAGSVFGLLLSVVPHSEAAKEPHLKVELYVIPEVLTGAYKIYGGQNSNVWVARALITNTGDVPVKDLNISYKITNYSDWTNAENYAEIVPGETVRDYCWPDFRAEDMQKINTKTAAEVTMQYSYAGMTQPKQDMGQFYFLGKNDFVWTFMNPDDIVDWNFADSYDNATLLPAYVTTNDPTIQEAAKALTAGISTDTDDDTLNAIASIWGGLQAYGMQYVSEPNTFWTAEFGQHIQFPVETLNNRGGNCVDLSLLFSSLAEAVGIKTYLVLSEGHCQVAFELPESGDIYPLEETEVGIAGVTAAMAVSDASDWMNQQIDQGTFFPIDVREQWQNGVVPSW